MVKTILILLVTVIVLPLVVLKLDPHPLSDWQWSMIRHSGMAMLIVALSCFMLAEITKNCSQVDKIWSIVPIGYLWYFAYASEWQPRIVLMAILVTAWGVRLTYNFSRRGAYKLKFWEGEEDYRWGILRNNPPFAGHPFGWKLFNLFFISLYQNALIWMFCLPAVIATTSEAKAIGIVDIILTILFLFVLLFETIADQQQWNFQTEKHRRLKENIPLDGEYVVGFVRTGLWKWIRHPNYAAEQSTWILFYLFSVSATGHWINASMAGALLLLILFQGSSDFSEKISADKYPLYKEYQKSTGRFFPKFW